MNPNARINPALRLLITVALLIATLVLATGAGSAGASTTAKPRFGTGALPAKVKVAPKLPQSRFGEQAVVPTSSDLTANAPTPGNQGRLGSCVTWAVDYGLLGWYAKAQGHAGAPFAPMYTYPQIRVSGGGSFIEDALRLAAIQGSGTASNYREQGLDPWGNSYPSDQLDQNFRVPAPTTEARSVAAGHKVGSGHPLFAGAYGTGTTGIEQLRYELGVNRRPVVIAGPIYTSLFDVSSQNPVYTPSGRIEGGHAMLALGYNPSGLLIQNSWGTGWGDGGRFWMPWNIVGRDIHEAYVLDSAFANVSVTAPRITRLTKEVALNGTVGTSVPVTFRWAGESAVGIQRYSVWTNSGGAGWIDRTSLLTSPAATAVNIQLSRGITHNFAVVAQDSRGTWGAYTASGSFTPRVFDDHAASISPSAGWTRLQWTSAFGGALLDSGRSGDYASFRFSGASGVAWVTTRASNRGQAHVFVDGIYARTVDLYSSATTPRVVAFSRAGLDPNSVHTITIQVVGTASRPYVDIDAFTTA